MLPNNGNMFLGMKRRAVVKHLAAAVLVPLLGMVLALTTSVASALLLDMLQCSMSWYTHSSLVLPLYFLPSLFALAAPLYVFTACRTVSKSFTFLSTITFFAVLKIMQEVLFKTFYTCCKSQFIKRL